MSLPESQPPRSSPPRPTADALLCALVLAPTTYSRNRFFKLYEDARLSRVRRRAALVRSLLSMLRTHGEVARAAVPTVVDPAGDVDVVLDLRELGVTRRTRLGPIELVVLRFALELGDDALRAADRARVEQALAGLMAL